MSMARIVRSGDARPCRPGSPTAPARRDQRDVDLRQIRAARRRTARGRWGALRSAPSARQTADPRQAAASVERSSVNASAGPLRLLGVEADDHVDSACASPRGDGLLDGGRRQRAIPPQVRLDLVRVAEVHVVLVQHVGLAAKAADALEPRHELGLLLGLRAFEFGDRRPLLRQARDLGGHALLNLGRATSPGRAVACTTNSAGDLGRDVERGHLRGQLLVVHERLVQPRRQPVGQNPRGDVQRRVVFGKYSGVGQPM